MTDPTIQVWILQIANLVASKQLEIAMANEELTRCNEWRSDHHVACAAIDAEIEAIQTKIFASL